MAPPSPPLCARAGCGRLVSLAFLLLLLSALIPSTTSFLPPSSRPALIARKSLELSTKKKRVRKDGAKFAPQIPPTPEEPPEPIPQTFVDPLPATTPNDESDGSSFDSLLADAGKFRSRESKDVSADEQIGNAIGKTMKNTISTIITVDFFVILFFLAWFVAGVISSTVFKNDAIQIAFNGIFQPLVQPALGILMIGSIAGGALGRDVSEED